MFFAPHLRRSAKNTGYAGVRNMQIPSYKASIIAGAACMPLLEFILNFIDNHYSHVAYVGFTKFLIMLMLFFIPTIIATSDVTYFKRKYNKYIFVRLDQIGMVDFKEFHIPAIKRICVWFASGTISILTINAIKNLSNLWL
jgi:hypothetical protein